MARYGQRNRLDAHCRESGVARAIGERRPCRRKSPKVTLRESARSVRESHAARKCAERARSAFRSDERAALQSSLSRLKVPLKYLSCSFDVLLLRLIGEERCLECSFVRLPIRSCHVPSPTPTHTNNNKKQARCLRCWKALCRYRRALSEEH